MAKLILDGSGELIVILKYEYQPTLENLIKELEFVNNSLNNIGELNDKS